jgi:hypothetical protein
MIVLKAITNYQIRKVLLQTQEPVFGKNAFPEKMRFGKNFTGPKRKLDQI